MFNIKYVLILSLMVFVGVILASKVQNTSKTEGEPSTVELPNSSFELEGEYTCLPHKDNDSPHTMECALGMKTDQSEYYALDLALLSQDEKNIPTGKHIFVEGLLVPIEQISSNAWQTYDIKGIIQVKKMELNK